MPTEEHTLKVNSIVRVHKTKYETLGLIESKVLATIIGKRILEVKYTEK